MAGIITGKRDDNTTAPIDVDAQRRLQTSDRPVASALERLLSEIRDELRRLRVGMIAAGACQDIKAADVQTEAL